MAGPENRHDAKFTRPEDENAVKPLFFQSLPPTLIADLQGEWKIPVGATPEREIGWLKSIIAGRLLEDDAQLRGEAGRILFYLQEEFDFSQVADPVKRRLYEEQLQVLWRESGQDANAEYKRLQEDSRTTGRTTPETTGILQGEKGAENNHDAATDASVTEFQAELSRDREALESSRAKALRMSQYAKVLPDLCEQSASQIRQTLGSLQQIEKSVTPALSAQLEFCANWFESLTSNYDFDQIGAELETLRMLPQLNDLDGSQLEGTETAATAAYAKRVAIQNSQLTTAYGRKIDTLRQQLLQRILPTYASVLARLQKVCRDAEIPGIAPDTLGYVKKVVTDINQNASMLLHLGNIKTAPGERLRTTVADGMQMEVVELAPVPDGEQIAGTVAEVVRDGYGFFDATLSYAETGDIVLPVQVKAYSERPPSPAIPAVKAQEQVVPQRAEAEELKGTELTQERIEPSDPLVAAAVEQEARDLKEDQAQLEATIVKDKFWTDLGQRLLSGLESTVDSAASSMKESDTLYQSWPKDLQAFMAPRQQSLHINLKNLVRLPSHPTAPKGEVFTTQPLPGFNKSEFGALSGPAAVDSKDALDRYLNIIAQERYRIIAQARDQAESHRKQFLGFIEKYVATVIDGIESAIGYSAAYVTEAKSKYPEFAPSIDRWYAGQATWRAELLQMLHDTGVEQMAVQVGKPADYRQHEPFDVEANASLPDETVTQVTRNGYVFRLDAASAPEIVRPAQVVVVKN